MNEINPNVKYTFTKIGLVYTIFSIAVNVLQMIILNVIHYLNPEITTINFQVFVSSAILYILGFVILGTGLKDDKLTTTKIEKHSMKFMDFVKAFCMCYALLIASNIVGIVITTVIGMVKGSPVVNPVETLVTEMSLPVMFFFTVVCAPIFEELFFRKFLVDKTIRFGEVPCMLISGFMFGLFHGNLSQFPYAFAIGAFFAYIYIRTGKIVYPMILHAIVNFMGSIVGAVVLKYVNYDAVLSLDSAATEAEMLEAMLPLITDGGFILFLLYEVFAITLVAIGIVLWILNWKRIKFGVQDEEIIKGDRLVIVMGNYGMIAYTAVWIIMIIYNTFINV